MTPDQFLQNQQRDARKLENYIVNEFPHKAGKIAIRFIDGNFQAQGWQGFSFQPWKANKRQGRILIKKGNLRRSIHFITAPGQVTVFSDSPYAAVHNRGFNGTITVRAHSRGSYGNESVGTGRFNKSGTERMRTVHPLLKLTEVASYTRHMKIDKRQFMPEHQNDSPVFANAIKREITRKVKEIFNT